jgi:hypothetical protein
MRLPAVPRAPQVRSHNPRQSGAAVLAPLLALAAVGCFPEPAEIRGRPQVEDPMVDAGVNADTQQLQTDTQQLQTDSAPMPVGANNSADLEMGDVGTKLAPAASLRKRLAVNVPAGMPAGFTLGQAYGIRLFASGKSIDIVIPITNTGPEIWCGVHMTRVAYKDANAATVLVTTDITPVYGSVAVVNATWISTCVAPGETSYFFDIQNPKAMEDYYTPTTQLDIDVKALAKGEALDARVLPVVYQYRPGDFTVQVKNLGPKAARLRDFSTFIVLDGEGPVAWELLKPAIDKQVLVANDTAALNNARMITTASGGRVHAIIDFEDPNAPTTTAATDRLPAGLRALEAASRAHAQRLLRAR